MSREYTRASGTEKILTNIWATHEMVSEISTPQIIILRIIPLYCAGKKETETEMETKKDGLFEADKKR